MILLGFLPPILFFLTAGHIHAAARRSVPTPGWRDHLLVAAVSVGAWVVIGTELLSLVHAIRFGAILLWWLVPVIGLAALLPRRRSALSRLFDTGLPRNPVDRVLLLICLALTMLGAAAATFSPPNNWDALSYHLPRQVYWIQHGTVAHFAANDLRMLQMPPFAEYVGMHLMVLSGGDHWSNLIQTFAWVLTLCAVSLIVRELGGNTRAQVVAALLGATIPVAGMEASSPKNDLIVSLWICILARYGLKFLREGKCSTLNALVVGAAFGLLLLTKGTGVVFALPLLLMICLGLRKLTWAPALSKGALALAACLGLNLGFFGRNLPLFGSVIGPVRGMDGGVPVLNESFSAPSLLSNLARNSSLHLGTPSVGLNQKLTRGALKAARLAGIDLNDPRTTFPSWEPFRVEYFPFMEDKAPAPLHFSLALLLPFLFWARKDLRNNSPLVLLFAVGCGEYVLFSWMLKWQQWNVRLQLPIFFLLAPVISIALAKWRRWTLAATGAALMIALPSLLLSESRPLLGKGSVFRSSELDLMFRGRGDAMKEGTAATVEYVKSLRPGAVGFRLVSGWDSAYLLQRPLLRDLAPPPAFIEFNPLWARSANGFNRAPDVVIATSTYQNALIDEGSGAFLYPMADFRPYRIYVRLPAGSKPPDLSSFAFTGWDHVEGLDPDEGPFPELGLPVIRWGKPEDTVIHFQATGSAAALVLEAWTDSPKQVMEISLNGNVIRRFPFTSYHEIHKLRITLDTLQGFNELRIHYSSSTKAGDRDLTVMFQKLQILGD